MPSVCCVPPCRSRGGGYTFPSDAKLRKWWIAAVRRDKWHPVAASQVCQRHFVEDKYVAITTLSYVEDCISHIKGLAMPYSHIHQRSGACDVCFGLTCHSRSHQVTKIVDFQLKICCFHILLSCSLPSGIFSGIDLLPMIYAVSINTFHMYSVPA